MCIRDREKAVRLKELMDEFFEITRFSLEDMVLEQNPVNVSMMLEQIADCLLYTSRPIDQHLKGFRALGADVKIEHGFVIAEAQNLHGSHIYLDVVSVGATINIMMAASLAAGNTILENAAKEPHVVDVANFLNSMGANIKGAGTDVIRIQGVPKLHQTEYSIIPDQIEAGTFMFAAAATQGDVMVKNFIPKHLEATTAKLIEIGCEVEEFDDAVRVVSSKGLHHTHCLLYTARGV